MRVLYFSRDYTTHDHRFLAALAKSGLETHFLRLERGPRQMEDRPLPPQVQPGELARRAAGRLRWRDLPGRALGLRRIVRELKPDVIHAGPLQPAPPWCCPGGGPAAGEHVLGLGSAQRCPHPAAG